MATDIMSFQYMPLYTGDYLRDTRHLTPLKHGIFMLLLMHCWDQKGPIPLDEQETAGIANCRSADEIDSLRYVLEKYFVKMDDGWYNKRMAEEVAKSEIISSNRQKAGQLSAAIRNRKKANSKRLSDSQANAEHMLNISSTLDQQVFNTCSKTIDHNPILTLDLNPNPKTPTVDQPFSPVLKSKIKNTVEKKTLDHENSFETEKKILAFLNEKTGRAYRAVRVNLEFIKSRIAEGYTEQECRMVIAKKTREWLDDDEMSRYLRPSTLFNRTKFNQYAGECVVQQEPD